MIKTLVGWAKQVFLNCAADVKATDLPSTALIVAPILISDALAKMKTKTNTKEQHND